MKKMISVLAVVFAAVTLAPAQANFEVMRATSQPGAPQAVVTGYLVDAKCANANMNALTILGSSHATACAIGCPTGEYGVVFEGMFISFDEKASKKVAKLLSKTTVQKGLRVTARGTLEGDTLTVSNLKEVKPEDDK
jgi:hypothetical protein